MNKIHPDDMYTPDVNVSPTIPGKLVTVDKTLTLNEEPLIRYFLLPYRIGETRQQAENRVYTIALEGLRTATSNDIDTVTYQALHKAGVVQDAIYICSVEQVRSVRKVVKVVGADVRKRHRLFDLVLSGYDEHASKADTIMPQDRRDIEIHREVCALKAVIHDGAAVVAEAKAVRAARLRQLDL